TTRSRRPAGWCRRCGRRPRGRTAACAAASRGAAGRARRTGSPSWLPLQRERELGELAARYAREHDEPLRRVFGAEPVVEELGQLGLDVDARCLRRRAGDDERALAARGGGREALRELGERAAHVLLVQLRELAPEARAAIGAERGCQVAERRRDA